MEKKSLFARWRGNFLTGLAVVLPAIISIAVVVWLFGTATKFTDLLLFFLPKHITHQGEGGSGPVHWYWSVVAFLIAITLISGIGFAARLYIGRKVIELTDRVILHVPLLNNIYGALKQVNEALTTGKKSAFKTVVLIQFPSKGQYSVGFITSEQHAEVQAKTKEKVVCVFVPTTPNPTTGFLVLVPEQEVTKLEMSVADAVKFIISLGSVSPEYPGGMATVSQPRTGDTLPP
jgi:uncharacterized membrane protein